MAQLVLDIEVKGRSELDKTTKDVYKLGKAGESIEKTFKRLKVSGSLSGIPVTIKKMNEEFVKTDTQAKQLLKTLKGYGSSGFKDLARDQKTVLKLTDELNAELNKQAKLQAKLAKQGKGTPLQNSLAKQLRIMKKQTVELRKQTGEYKKQKAAATGLTSKLSGIGKLALGGAGFAAGALGIVGIISTVQRLIDLWARLTRTVAESFYTINSEAQQSRILLSTALGNESAGARMFDEVLEMATQMPFSIKAISDSFVKLQTAGIENAGEKVTILADAISAFGGTDEDLRLATIAIQQMAGKGVAAMEELRRQLGERVPTAIRGMAREMGITYLELVDKVSTGTLLFDEKAQGALFKGLQEHAGAAKKRMDSMLGAVKLLQTAWQRFMIDIGDGNNAFNSLSKIVKSVAEALNTFRTSTEGRKVIDDISEAISNMVDKVTPEAIYGAFKLIEKIARFTLEIVKVAVDLGLQLLEKFSKQADKPELFTVAAYKKITGKSGGLEVDTGGLSSALLAIREQIDGFSETLNKDKDPFGLGEAMESSVEELNSTSILEESNIKNLTLMGERIKAEVGGIDKAIDELTGDLLKLEKEFGKKLVTNEREELKFAVKFELGGEGPSLKEQVKELDDLIQQTNVNDKAGREEVLALLVRQRDLIREMNTDAEKVTKSDVAAAKAVFDELSRTTRDGRAAGTREAYQAAAAEYIKLRRLEKEGLADDREEKLLAKEKLDLLQRNTQLTRQAQDRSSVPTRTEIQKLEEEANKKTELHKLALSQLEELKKKKAEDDEIKRLEEEAKERGKNHESAMSDVEKLKLAEQKAHEEKMTFLDKQIAKAKEFYEILRAAASLGTGVPSNIEAKALGGPVKAMNTYLVGEKGPELFMPESDGQIIPNDAMSTAFPTEPRLIMLQYDVSEESLKRVGSAFQEQLNAIDVDKLIELGITPEPEVDLGPYQKILDDAIDILTAPTSVTKDITVTPEITSGHRMAHLDIQMEEMDAYRKKVEETKKEVASVAFEPISLPSPGGTGRDHNVPENLGEIYKLDDGSFTNQTEEQREAFEKLGDSIRVAGEAKQEYARVKVDNYYDHDPSGGEGVWRNYILQAQEAKVATEDVQTAAKKAAYDVAQNRLDKIFGSSGLDVMPSKEMVLDVQAELNVDPQVPADTRAEYDRIVAEEERKMSEAMANMKPYQMDPAIAKELDFLQFGQIDADLNQVFKEIDASPATDEIRDLNEAQQKFIDSLNLSGQQYTKVGAERKADLEEIRAGIQKEIEAEKERQRLLAEEQAKAAQIKDTSGAEIEAINNKKETEGQASNQALENLKDVMERQGDTIDKTGDLQEVWVNQLQLMKEMSMVDPYASVGASGGGGADLGSTSYPGRYAGGPVSANQPYIVGERGPELFVPSNNGQIVPNNELQNSETTTINFSFQNRSVGPFYSKKQTAKELLSELEIMQGEMS